MRRRPVALAAVAALVLGALAAIAGPAGAHGGDVGVGAGASATGPLSASVDASATWLNDGDPASGLSMSVSGANGSVPMVETSEGQYHANVSFPAGGTYQLSINWSGNGSTPGGTSVSVSVPGAAPPTTAPPATAPPATAPPGTAAPGNDASATTTPSSTTTTAPAEPGAVAPVTVAAGLLGAPVIVVPSSVPRGGYATVSFAVPDASTTLPVSKVTIEMPATTNLVGISLLAMPGWQSTVTKRPLAAGSSTSSNVTEAIAQVTWTAVGDGLAPGQFDLFTFSAGPFPKQGSVARFTVRETLANGDVVSWDQVGTKTTPAPPFRMAAVALTRARASSSTSSFSHG